MFWDNMGNIWIMGYLLKTIVVPGCVYISHFLTCCVFQEANVVMQKKGAIEFHDLPSGKLTVCYWTWPFIVDLPIKNGDFP